VTSCGSLEKQLHDAAEAQGKVEAGVNLPPLPDDCRRRELHALDAVGDEAVVLWKAERRATNRANDRVTRCAQNYDNVAAALAGKPDREKQ
jgi:hypothetical protein